ncbi:protein RRNAD1-like [Apis laboriosa]|uniref:protein RRNAD1-like n=1 Tax=Apis laboriosa TaxID=183418 RepID=UPI001CC7C370|nr:protein RRNAD1-like [Apis laboriosa]
MAAPTDIRCTCKVCTRIRVTIDQIFCVLDLYGWLLNSYIVDFFQDKLWDKLPESWRFALQDTPPQEFGKWLSGDISCTRVWPLTLLALRQVANILQVNRDNEDPKSIMACESNKTKTNNNYNDTFTMNKNDNFDKLYFQNHKFNNLFSKHIKKKKRYEIHEIAQVCAECAYEASCKCIVDIGSGMGHLARILAFQYGLYVTCIEQDCILLQQARKWDQELLMSIRKHIPTFYQKCPQHFTAKLEPSNLVESELIRQLKELFKNEFDLNETETEFGLIGLHPCGDLAPILLKLYSSRNEAKFICIVGCCYMKLTIQSEINGLKGYPLSKYLLCKNHSLTYTSLEVACHAIEKYCDKLKNGNYEDLIVHTYRAALETILVKKNEKLRHSQFRNVKVSKGMSFEQYCNAATANFDSYLQPQDSDINDSEIIGFLKRWQQVIVFGSLRMMLAPLVETIVLYDRFLFLSEKNLTPTLKPVFDSRLSPRNLVLMSRKNN